MIGATPALKRFITQAPSGDAWIDTLEINHPTFSQPYVLMCFEYPFAITFEDGRRYDPLPLAFRVELPGAGTGGRQDMSITIDNVGAEVWRALERAQTQPTFPIAVTWRVYLKSDASAPAAQPLHLAVTGVTATLDGVQMLAERSDTINAKWPRVVYRPARWPGLVR
jgi:hypothetical protein